MLALWCYSGVTYSKKKQPKLEIITEVGCLDEYTTILHVFKTHLRANQMIALQVQKLVIS